MRVRIETESFGDASNPDIFMVSGWAMPKEVMQDFANALKGRFHVVVANLPGISLSEAWITRSRIGPNYDIDALTEQLIEAAPKNAWWLGWSLGGMISVYVAARRSSCVKGLITLSTSPSFVERTGWQYGMASTDFDAFVSLVEDKPEQGLKRFIMLQTKGAEKERELVSSLQSLLPIKTLNSPALIGGLRLLKNLDVRREWSLLDMPNLHLFGEKDGLVSAKVAELDEVANPFQSCYVFPNCAHQSFLENPEECVRQIETFIDANK